MQQFDVNFLDKKDDTAIPMFYVEAQENPHLTKKNGGVPEFQEMEMVKIIVPGSRDIVIRPVNDKDRKERWPRQYKMWKDGLDPMVEGIPIKEFSVASEIEKQMLRSIQAQTVEQVANLTEEAIRKLGGKGRSLQQRAQEFLKSRTGVVEVTSLKKEVEDLKTANSELRAQVQTLLKELGERKDESSVDQQRDS